MRNWDIFLRTGPFLMPNSVNAGHGHACSYTFGFKQKCLFFEKLEPKTVGDRKKIGDFHY